MDENRYKKLNDAQVGEKLTRPLLVATIIENTAKNGKPFLKITFKDGFSEVVANLFDNKAETLAARGITAETIADVTLSVSEYQGAKSYIVEEIAPTKATDLTLDDFTKLPPVPLDKMYNEICDLIRSSADNCGGKYNPLSDLALKILENYKAGYMSSSAAVAMHHNLKGGLLYHSYRMTKAAAAICSVYTDLDKELIVCGAALHDIGKLWEYNTLLSGEAEYTTKGILFGHIYMGAMIIKSSADGGNYNPEKIQLLTHLILSHHGTHEWGAVSLPAVPEALALHYIDNLDAKMYIFENAYETTEAGTITSKKPFGLDGRIYKPAKSEDSE